MGKWVYQRQKKVPGKPGMWPERKKMEVVTTYLSTGSIRLTSAMTNVPEDTIYLWKRSDWWKDIVDQIREDDSTELDSKLAKVLAKSISAVEDRVENGEIIIHPKTGKPVRTPARLRDLHRVSVDLIDKRQTLQKRNVAKIEAKENTEARLLKLAETFAQIALGKEVKEVKEIYEGEYTDESGDSNAVHDQRETGLQEGIELGAQEETQPGEGSCSEELRESNGG